jgi:hypothetical protein
MDSFEKKHEMIQQLLSMLKSHAVNEVEGGLKKPEGEGDMHGIQTERVEDVDHEMDHPTPEHDVVTHEMNKGGMAYNKGGVVDKVSTEDPTPKIHSGPMPHEPQSGDGKPEGEGSAHEEATESDEEREMEGDIEPMHSPFESFLSRKKKK